MNIKILFADLDGTLVEHAGNVTQETVKSAQKLREKGVEIVIVTGRHPDMTKSIHHDMGLKTPVIGCNGGVIKEIINNKVLHVNELSQEIIKQTIQVANQLGVDWIVYEKDRIFYQNMPPKSYKQAHRNQDLPENLRANFIHLGSENEMYNKDCVFLKSLLLFDKNIAAMDEAYKLLRKINGCEILSSANNYIDVMAVGSSKGKAVKRYLNMIDIKKENIVAIGDAQNDVDMIEYAELGIAMGNATDEVKAVAQYVTTAIPKGFGDAALYLLNMMDDC